MPKSGIRWSPSQGECVIRLVPGREMTTFHKTYVHYSDAGIYKCHRGKCCNKGWGTPRWAICMVDRLWKTPEYFGPFVWTFGISVYRQLIDKVRLGHDLFDPHNGNDLTILWTGRGLGSRYKVTLGEKTPLGSTPEELQAIIDSAPNISGLPEFLETDPSASAATIIELELGLEEVRRILRK